MPNLTHTVIPPTRPREAQTIDTLLIGGGMGSRVLGALVRARLLLPLDLVPTPARPSEERRCSVRRSFSMSSRSPVRPPLGQSVRQQWDFYTNFHCLRRRRRRRRSSEPET